jgi:uncharacterized protein (DUF1684 family)
MATGSTLYEQQIQKWRDEYAAELTGPEGPFTVIARLIPKQGVSTVGGDKSCDLVVSLPKVPSTIGRLEFDRKRAMLRLVSTVRATVDKRPVTTVEISNEKSTEVAINGFKLRFGFRDGVLRMTIVDPDSPMRRKAAPVKWFPAQDKYRITADWFAYPKPKLVHLADSDGSGRDWQCLDMRPFVLRE